MTKKLLAALLLEVGSHAAVAQQPANNWAGLARYAEANRRLPAPKPGRPRVVLVGNSITEFWLKTDSAFFAGSTYDYVNRGISGQTSPQTLLRFRQDALDLSPAVVVLLIGTNDVAENTGPYDPQATLNNIKSMAELTRAHGSRVVLCSVLPASDFPWHKGLEPGPKIVALNQQLKAYAAQQHFDYLDYHAALVDSHLGLPPALAADGVHPTLAGYRVMEPLLQQAVAAALKAKK